MDKLFIIFGICTVTCCANAWEDDPRLEEHNKLTDRLIKLGDDQVKCKDKDTMDLLNLIVSERT